MYSTPGYKTFSLKLVWLDFVSSSTRFLFKKEHPLNASILLFSGFFIALGTHILNFRVKYDSQAINRLIFLFSSSGIYFIQIYNWKSIRNLQTSKSDVRIIDQKFYIQLTFFYARPNITEQKLTFMAFDSRFILGWGCRKYSTIISL